MALTLEGIVDSSLREKGIYVSRDWINQGVGFVKSRKLETDPSKIANYIYKLFLYSDYHETYSTADLDESISFLLTNACCIVSKPLVFQVDEITNVGASYNQKLNPNCSRLLKLYLVIGNKKFVGIEMNRIAALNANMVAGTKILVNGAHVRRNCVMLTTGNVQVLGGEVERLSSIQAHIKSTERIGGGSTATTSTTNNNNIRNQGQVQIPSTQIVVPLQPLIQMLIQQPLVTRPELQPLISNQVAVHTNNANIVDSSRSISSSNILFNSQNSTAESVNSTSNSSTGNQINSNNINKPPTISDNKVDNENVDINEVQQSIIPPVAASTTNDAFIYEMNTETPNSINIPDDLDLMSLSPVSSQTYLHTESNASSNNNVSNSNTRSNRNISTLGLRNTTTPFASSSITDVQDLISPIDCDKLSGNTPIQIDDDNNDNSKYDSFEMPAVVTKNIENKSKLQSVASSLVDVTDNIEVTGVTKRRTKKPITLASTSTTSATAINPTENSNTTDINEDMVIRPPVTVPNRSSSSSFQAQAHLSADDLQQIQSAETHYFKYFKFPESELVHITSVPIRAACNGITKFKVINHSEYIVWLKMDDQDSEEIVSVPSDIVTSFLNMTPQEYETKTTTICSEVEGEKEEEDHQKTFRAAIGLKFRDFIGVFQTKRIDIKNTLTTKEQRKYKGPLLEFIQVDFFEDLSTNQ